MRIISIFVLLTIFVLHFLDAAIKKVPQDFTKIQLAINAAVNGDTVLVAEGTYVENLNITKKIVLASLYILDLDTTHISKTILDGGIPHHPDSGSVIHIGLGTDTNTAVKGFTIQNGKGARFPGSTYLSGGGINIIGGGATIDHNIIKNNSCRSAIYSTGAAGIEILVDPNGIGPANWAITNNTIINNTSATTAPSTAGEADGGGLDLTGTGKVLNNIIMNNNASGSYVGAGGGVVIYGYIKSTNITFSNNLVISNQASHAGGGIAMWVNKPYRPKVSFSNNIIAKNSSAHGSAMFVNSGDYSFVNNTITDNSGFETIFLVAERGALIFRLLNNIVWDTLCSFEFNSSINLTGSYNCVRNGMNGTENISENPRFAMGEKVYQLSDSSYCIARGKDSAQISGVWYHAPHLDYTGAVRPQPNGSVPDIGAIEHSSGITTKLPPKELQIDSLIRKMILKISADSIRATIQSLQNFQTRFALASNRDSIARWLRSEFNRYGFTETSIDSFNAKGLYFSDPFESMQYNVVATLRGSKKPATEIVIGAHYDSWAEANPYLSAPGADDNASGVAAVLEIARVLKTTEFRPKVSITFVAFAIEELGLFGSDDFAHKAADAKKEISHMICFDAISRSTYGAVNIFPYTNALPLAETAKSLTNKYTSLASALQPALNISGTDSYSFYKYGFPATAFNDNVFAPYNHTTGDIIDHSDLPYCAEVTKAGFATLLKSDHDIILRVTLKGSSSPTQFVLEQNFPNPFNPSTTIRYSLPSSAHVKLTIYNMLGQAVCELVNEDQSVGWKEVQWNAGNFASGMYLVRLNAGSFVEAKKILLMK